MTEMTERALHQLLLKIPRGKVTTYKILADKLKSHPRKIAKLLSQNKYPDRYPCYRVVNSNGSLGGYAGGIRDKTKRLKNDGIKISKNKIDLSKYLYRF